jgi:predicted O-methyltransferase YrrM
MYVFLTNASLEGCARLVHALDIAYSIVDWRDDPYTPSGRERFLSALDRFKKLLDHPWFSKLLGKKKMTIVDVGAGKGIGGVALALALQEHGLESRVYMVDIREEALKTASRFASENKVVAETLLMDARELYKTSIREVDLVLMYGGILAHFNEWDLVKLFASATSIIGEDGIILIEEFDRDHMLYTRGYKDFLVEKRGMENITISVHEKYDPVTGSYHRLFIDLLGHRSVEVSINFRSIAQIAAMLWIFMEDIDIVYTGESLIYYILGRKPRHKISVNDLTTAPEVLKRGSFSRI